MKLCCRFTFHPSIMLSQLRVTDRETQLTISTLCSGCRRHEYPAMETDSTSWVHTCNLTMIFRLNQQVNGALSRCSTQTTQLILPLTISSNALHCRAAGATVPDLFLYSRCQSAASCYRLEALESADSTSSRIHCSYICPAEDLPVKSSCL